MSPSNATCHKERAEDGPPFFQNGNIVFQAYHVGWIIAGFFAIAATAVSIWLVNKHLQWYTNKREQRYIVRLVFMVPIYALVSFASFLFWNHATVLVLIRDGYESTVLTAFFYLLLMYLSHDPEEQKSIFLKAGLSREADREARKKGEELKGWVFPLGFIKWKPQDGLYFLQLMKWGVLQYCVIRPTTTLAAVILDYMGLYCEESWGLGWGHIYITIIVSFSVTIAMYCLIQLYVAVSQNLAPHRPLLKLFAIKAVVFLTFWQATFLSVLSMFGVVKETKYMTAADINIGIGAILETFEMTLFAFLHIRAFTYRPYRPSPSPDTAEPEPESTPRLRSLGHAMDFRETFREIWIGWIHIWDKMRGKEPTPDVGARRIAHYEGAFGRSRALYPKGANHDPGMPCEEERVATLPVVEVEIEREVDVDIEGEKQWLGLGDNYGYGLGYIKREKSDDLAVQIERELEKRGYTTRIPGKGLIGQPHDANPGNNARRQSSWWRRIYSRFSEHGSEYAGEHGMSLMANESNRRSQRHSRGTKDVERDFLASYEPDIDDPPPSSIIQQHRSRRDSRRPTMTEDILAPLPIFKDPRISHPWAPSRGEVPNISGASRDNIYLRLDTGARRTLPPLTESSHADSLLGRIFTRTTESQPTDQVLVSSAGDELPASMNEEGRALLSRATRQILGQYYEFGVSADEVSPRTQYRYQHTPGPSAVQIIDSVQSQSQSLHRRESAHHPSYLAHSPSQPPAPLNRRRGGLRRPRELDAPVTPSSSPAHPLGQNSRDHYTSHNSASGRRSSSLNPNTLAHAHSSSDVMINDDPRGQNKQPRDSSAARRNPVNESSRRHSGVAPHTVDIAMDVPELQNLSRYPTSLHTSYTPTMPAQLVHDPRLHRFRQNDGSNLTPEALHGSPSRQ